MVNRHRNLAWSGLFAASVLAIFALVGKLDRNVSPLRPDHQSSIGVEEDLEGREAYEVLRLHDPATGMIPADIRTKELAFAAGLPAAEHVGALQKTSGVQALTWSVIGPANVGGRTRALGVDISNTTTILAGGISGGMWRSTNDGATWLKTTRMDQLQSVTCLAQDKRPGKTNTWYYGTGEYRGNSASGGGSSYSGDGIFKSTDGGLSWNLLAATSTNAPQTFDQSFDYVFNVATDSTRTDDLVLAATAGSILRSTNGGTSWTTVLGTLANTSSQYTDVAIGPNGIAYATMSSRDFSGTYNSTAKGFYRSSDGGATWTNIIAPTYPGSYRRVVIGIAPSNPNIVFFLGETPGAGYQTINSEATSLWRYTYVSGDGSGAGGVWVNRSANLPALGGTNSVGNFVTQLSYDIVMKVKPDDSNAVFVGGTNLYRSTDGFSSTANTTWIGGYNSAGTSYASYPNHHPDQHALVFSPANPNVAYSGHDGGVSKTTAIGGAPVVWTSLNNGYETAQFYSIALDHARSADNLLIGGTQDNGTWHTISGSSASPWTQTMGGDGGFSAVADSGSTLYGSFQNGITYKIGFNRVSGTATGFTEIDPTGGTNYLFISPYRLDPSNSKAMYFAAGTLLWRNSNLATATQSANWMKLMAASNIGMVSAIGVSTTLPAHRVYFGTSVGAIRRLDSADLADSTTTSVDVSTGKGLPASAYVSCLAVDPTDGNKVIAAFSNYGIISIYYTIDGGTTWTAVAGNLEQNSNGTGNGPSVRWVSIVPRGSTTTYFAGTSAGLYSTQTLNGMSTVWGQEGTTTIGNAVVDMIDARLIDGKVVVATHGGGAFWSMVPATSVAEAPVARSFGLSQNYPNPFNPTTNIGVRIAEAGMVTLKIYDMLGKEVTTLLNEKKSPGEYSVQFNASGLASGVYLAKLQTGNGLAVRKMILMK